MARSVSVKVYSNNKAYLNEQRTEIKACNVKFSDPSLQVLEAKTNRFNQQLKDAWTNYAEATTAALAIGEVKVDDLLKSTREAPKIAAPNPFEDPCESFLSDYVRNLPNFAKDPLVCQFAIGLATGKINPADYKWLEPELSSTPSPTK